MKCGGEVQTGKRYLHTIDNQLRITIQNIQRTPSNKAENKQTICMFPIAAATNYHKLSGLKQHRFILSLRSRPENQTGSHWAQIKVSARAMFLLKTLGKNPFLCLFQLLEVAHVPLLLAPNHPPSQKSHLRLLHASSYLPDSSASLFHF